MKKKELKEKNDLILKALWDNGIFKSDSYQKGYLDDFESEFCDDVKKEAPDLWETIMGEMFKLYDKLKKRGYEDREEQQDMTYDIIDAIKENQNIVVEARCRNWKIICIFTTVNAISLYN